MLTVTGCLCVGVWRQAGGREYRPKRSFWTAISIEPASEYRPKYDPGHKFHWWESVRGWTRISPADRQPNKGFTCLHLPTHDRQGPSAYSTGSLDVEERRFC